MTSPQAFSTIMLFDGTRSTKGISPWFNANRGLLDTQLSTKVPFHQHIFLCALTKSGCPKCTLASTKITLPWLQTSTEWRNTMRVPSVKQDSPLHADCGGTQRFVREGQPRWCAEESKSIFLKQHMKIVLRREGLCWKGGKLDRARGPMEGCSYPLQNVWPWWGKNGCRISSGWFLPGTNMVFQFHGCHWHGCPESLWKGKRTGLTGEMQYVRMLERRKVICDAGFELMECWEHDFHESWISPRKKMETFLHAIVYIFEVLLDVIRRLQATKDLLFKE